MESENKSGGFRSSFIWGGGLVFALFQLVLPVYVHFIELQLRAIHVAIGLSLAFLIFPFRKLAERKSLSLWDWSIVASS